MPQGLYAGMQMHVRAPNTGQQMTVVIPQGIGPGMQFLVPLPQPPQPQYAQPQYQQPQQYQQPYGGGYQQNPRYY